MTSKKYWLDNPWSDHSEQWTWERIEEWAIDNVHQNDLDQWLVDAQAAAEIGDSETLGIMIIGS